MKTYKVRCVRTNRLRGFGEVVLPHHPSVSDKADSASRLLREERYCAVDGLQQEPFDPGLIPEIGASAADVERWCRATHDLFEGVQTFHRWASTTLERLRNPPPTYRRILSWSKNLRITGHPDPTGREQPPHDDRLTRYQADWQRLHSELFTAHRVYDERTSDLTTRVLAMLNTLEQELTQEQHWAQKARQREQEARRPAMPPADPETRHDHAARPDTPTPENQ